MPLYIRGIQVTSSVSRLVVCLSLRSRGGTDGVARQIRRQIAMVWNTIFLTILHSRRVVRAVLLMRARALRRVRDTARVYYRVAIRSVRYANDPIATEAKRRIRWQSDSHNLLLTSARSSAVAACLRHMHDVSV